jgi:hypothetical protein
MSRETIAKRTIAERIAERLGLGQVQTLTRKARTALNPKTLEKVPVKSRVVVKFKVGRLLKEKVEHLALDGSEAPSPGDASVTTPTT